MRRLILALPILVFVLAFIANFYIGVKPAYACPYECSTGEFCHQSECVANCSQPQFCVQLGSGCWVCLD